MHIEFFPEHHNSADDSALTSIICVLSGIALTAYGFSTNAISVSANFSFTSFITAIVYASGGAAASYFVKMGLDVVKNTLSTWYKNRKDNDEQPPVSPTPAT